MDRHWYKPLRETAENMENAIKGTEKMIWREGGQKYLFEVKRVRSLLPFHCIAWRLQLRISFHSILTRQMFNCLSEVIKVAVM